MRLLKIPLYLFLLLFILIGVSEAQVIDCDGIGESPNDTVRIVSQIAAPGDTVLLPLLIANENGVAGFSAYLDYDANLLSPIVTGSDSLFDSLGNFLDKIQSSYDYLVGGRFLKTEIKIDSFGFTYLDTINNVNVVSEADLLPVDGRGRMAVFAFLTDFFTPEITIPAGSGEILYIKFIVDSTAPHNTIGSVTFYDGSLQVLSPVFPYDVIRNSCVYSRYSDSTGTIDRRFTVSPGVVRVDTAGGGCDDAVINSFSASPATITTLGGTSILSWSVVGSSAISINNGVGDFNTATGSVIVSPTTTTSYILTATNTCGSVQGFTTITVDIGGTDPTNINPVVQPISGSPFTVNQGETVAFSVTATDADASDIITLSAVSLPPNSSFSQAVGSNSVSSNFSFSPDFTQSGTFVAVFQATDDQGGSSAQVSVIINVVEIVNDHLFTTSSSGQQPVGGLRGTSGIYFPINLVTAKEVYGFQFDFHYDPVYFTVDSFITTGRTMEYVVYDNIGQTPGAIRVISFGLANEPIVNIVDTTAILYAVMSIDSAAPPGDYPVWFDNGWESISPDPDIASLELVVDGGIIQVDNPGDVNLDKIINVADLVNVVASVINNYTLSARQFNAADVVINDTVDVFDLVSIIDMVFLIPVSPAPPQIYEGGRGTIALTYNDLSAGGNELMVVNTELPVDIAAVELEINYDPASVVLGQPQISAAASDLDIRYSDDGNGHLKVLMYHTNPFGNLSISQGAAELISIPIIARQDIVAGDKNQLKISKANFSTSSSAKVEIDGVDDPWVLPDNFTLNQNYPNPFNPTTTIEFSIDASQEVKLEIFNILGQHVLTLVDGYLGAGTHSIEWDATSRTGQRVASGIYLYRLELDQATETKKMLFLK